VHAAQQVPTNCFADDSLLINLHACVLDSMALLLLCVARVCRFS